jgi:release factor glutamine methyltransferase
MCQIRMSAPTVTLASALQAATRALAATSPTPAIDAESLLMHVFGFGRATLFTRSSLTFDAPQYERYQQLVARRLDGEPVAYITGVREFWSLPIHVTPAVLIPRPETELLVECALAHLAHDADTTAADLGTGSGAIALAIAHERRHCQLMAIDASAEAIEVARDNARRLHLTNIDFRLGDWLAPVVGKKFDVIVSNPPYIRAGDPHLFEGDVRFEPPAALVSGRDGLDAIRRIAKEARDRLRAGGYLLLEHGYDQAEAVADILRQAHFHDIRTHRDLAGHERVTECRGPEAF